MMEYGSVVPFVTVEIFNALVEASLPDAREFIALLDNGNCLINEDTSSVK
jgi:hypothetical protein